MILLHKNKTKANICSSNERPFSSQQSVDKWDIIKVKTIHTGTTKKRSLNPRSITLTKYPRFKNDLINYKLKWIFHLVV